MNNKQALISAALLEAIWSSRKKDMIDLITPFILYGVATCTTPGNKIDTTAVRKYVQSHYAYPDLPESIVKATLARNPLGAFEKEDRFFILQKPLDNEIDKISQREQQCNEHISLLGEKLSEYLTSHCKKSKSITKENAINCLHMFFSRYGLEVGIEDLASVQIKPAEHEIEYYIARFIFECKDSNPVLYAYILDLVKGYFLRLAIYIQPDNGNIHAASFANVNFILDTPVLIDLLGYQGVERENNACSLYRMLKKQKAKLFYFPHIKQEIIDILTAYKYSLIPGSSSDSSKTLDGLNARGFDTSDVEREIQLLESKLEGSFDITEHDLPSYATRADNAVDETQVLGEEEIKQHVKDNTPHYKEENLNNDITSVLAIHKLRKGELSSNIESCRYIFVTNNRDFIQAFNNYYRTKVSRDTMQLAISVNALSAITWIKCGEVENLTETELLKNAYCAMQPIPEIMVKLEDILAKLKNSGQIQPEQVVALRASRVFQNELWTSSFGDLSAVDEHSVKQAKEKYEKSLIETTTEEHAKEIAELDRRHSDEIKALQEQLQLQEEKHNQALYKASNSHSKYIKDRDNADMQLEKYRNEAMRKKADHFAKAEREKWFNHRLRWVNILTFLLLLGGLGGLIASCVMASSWIIQVLLGVFSLITAISLIDTVYSKKLFIVHWLAKASYHFETKVREEKIAEYSGILQPSSRKESTEDSSQFASV